MRSSSPDNRRLGLALAVSLGLHAMLGIWALQVRFTPSSDSSISPQVLRVSVVPQLPTPPAPEESAETEPESAAGESVENLQTALPSEDPASSVPDEETVPTQEAVAVSGSQPVTEDTAGQENPERAPPDPAALRRSVEQTLATYGQNGTRRWMENCWRQRKQEGQRDCEDEGLVATPTEAMNEAFGDTYLAFNRAAIQASAVRRGTSEMVLLDEVAAAGGDTGAQAIERRRELEEKNRYLTGNIDTGFLRYMASAYQNNPFVSFMSYMATPRCKDGPCIFELNETEDSAQAVQQNPPARFELDDADMSMFGENSGSAPVEKSQDTAEPQ